MHDTVKLMPLPSLRPPELHDGDRMSREEFLWRWEQIPELKQAELIDGVVYLASPVSFPHSEYQVLFAALLTHYARASKAGFRVGTNTSLTLAGSVVQPDVVLVRNAIGVEGGYLEDVPDLIVEVSYSSVAHDLGRKLSTYRSAGVREYITVLVEKQCVEWRVLSGTQYRLLDPAQDGILKSPGLPGLWLDTQALFPLDHERLFAAIDRGVKTA